MSQEAKASLWQAALKLLALREHTVAGLRAKLPSDDPQLLTAVISELIDRGYVSDTRYCELYIRKLQLQCYGPMHILQALMSKGVAEELARQALAAADYDWSASARVLRGKRFGDTLPTDYPSRAKQMRFLQYRGFTLEQIKAVFRS